MQVKCAPTPPATSQCPRTLCKSPVRLRSSRTGARAAVAECPIALARAPPAGSVSQRRRHLCSMPGHAVCASTCTAAPPLLCCGSTTDPSRVDRVPCAGSVPAPGRAARGGGQMRIRNGYGSAARTASLTRIFLAASRSMYAATRSTCRCRISCAQKAVRKASLSQN